MKDIIDRVEALSLKEDDVVIVSFKDEATEEDIKSVVKEIESKVQNKVYAFSPMIKNLEVINLKEENIAKGSD